MSDLAINPTATTSLRWAVSDIATVTRRNVIRQFRVPEAIFFSTLQPIMFVLLFTFVFGGSIQVEGGYTNYLMPGIFVQTMVFGAVSTTIGLAEDLQSGLLERFRALPMSRAAVLGGRTSADFMRNMFVIVIMTAVGLMWGFAYIGLAAPNAETAQLMTFPILFPLTFASSAFAPVSKMPGWLQAFAAHQPVTQAADAARSLMLGGTYYNPGAIWASLAWSVGLLAILAPLAVRKYRKV